MLQILLALLLMTTPAWATVAWRNGTGANTLLGSSQAADIDTNTYNNIVSPLDSLLANYRQGLNIAYDSAAQFTVTAGEVTVSNSDGSIRLMLKNAGSTTVTWADIDTGAEASSTTYYVYAVGASASATAVTFKISASSTSPSGITYYKKLGSFYNDSSSNISAIVNDNQITGYVGAPTSKSTGTTYQALTDGIVEGYGGQTAGGEGDLTCYTDSSSSPTFVPIEYVIQNDVGTLRPYTMIVRKGDYWKCTISAHWSNSSLYFIPTGS